MSEPTKNIILCADGTGNRGGETPDTNVYRMYHAVELHDPKRQRPQITYYDNGVGTSTNKYIRTVSGALGFGFRDNVKDLYEYLARHYKKGDLVYVFGFSRGAATVRAFAGFLEKCGLIDPDHASCEVDGEFNYDKFVERIDEAFENYRKGTGDVFKAGPGVNEVRIKFMGIWDTVSALGFPYQRVGDSLLEGLIERPLPVWLALALDRVFDFGPFAHRFYKDPEKIVDHVYHAIAIDDERKSFLPLVWDENLIEGKITQVWFTGMHSDVGGSYNQTGLAYVTMEWMMERAGHHGLDFVQGALQGSRDMANADGKVHNSRDGLAIYYRYAPRDIEDLSTRDEPGQRGKLLGPIKIHESAIDRMRRHTGRYSPGLLPLEFDVVKTCIPSKNEDKTVEYGVASANPVDPHVVDVPTRATPKADTQPWAEDRDRVKSVVRNRRRLFRVLADLTFFLGLGVLWLWRRSGQTAEALPLDSRIWRLGLEKSPFADGGQAEQVLTYFLPTVFDAFIQEAVVNAPTIIVAIVAVFVALRVVRTRWLNRTKEHSVAMREKICAALYPPAIATSDGAPVSASGPKTESD